MKKLIIAVMLVASAVFGQISPPATRPDNNRFLTNINGRIGLETNSAGVDQVITWDGTKVLWKAAPGAGGGISASTATNISFYYYTNGAVLATNFTIAATNGISSSGISAPTATNISFYYYTNGLVITTNLVNLATNDVAFVNRANTFGPSQTITSNLTLTVGYIQQGSSTVTNSLPSYTVFGDTVKIGGSGSGALNMNGLLVTNLGNAVSPLDAVNLLMFNATNATLTPLTTAADYASQATNYTDYAINLTQAYTVYGATNAHPVMGATIGSFWPTVPIPAGPPWTNSYTLSVGTQLVGNRFDTNALVNYVPAGTYEHTVYQRFTGGGTVTYRSDLAIIKSDLTVTNTLVTGNTVNPTATYAPQISTSLLTTNYNVPAGTWYLGVLRYATRSGGAASFDVIGGSDLYPTHLQGPRPASVSGYATIPMLNGSTNNANLTANGVSILANNQTYTGTNIFTKLTSVSNVVQTGWSGWIPQTITASTADTRLDVSKGNRFYVQLVDNVATTITVTNTATTSIRGATNGQMVVIEVANPASGTVPVALLNHAHIKTNSVAGDRTTYPWTNSTPLSATDLIGISWPVSKTQWLWMADKHNYQ